MSLKLHQTGPGGRRTPLSLGQSSRGNNKPQQVTEIIDIDELDDLPLSQTIAKKSSNAETKSDNKKSLIPIPSEKNIQSSPSDSKSAKDLSINKNVTKKDTEKKHENGHDQSKNHQKDKTNGHKQNDDTKVSTNGNDKIEQKDIQKSPQIMIVEQHEYKEKPGPKSKKLAEKEKRRMAEEASSTTAAAIASPMTVTTTSSPPKRSQRAAAIQANVSIASLAFEKDFRGFNENGEEMESLLYDVDIPEEVMNSPVVIPTKAKSNNSSTSSTPKKDISEEKKSTFDPSPNKTPYKSHILSPSITSTPDNKGYYTQPPASLRSITGRRSLRPKDFNFRDSYRKTSSEFDCSGNTSLNVTVGSQKSNDSSLSLFSFFGRGKKRERTPPPKSPEHCQAVNDDTDMDVSVGSPKRARIDLGGLFGIVASPVTMLRARLSRAKIENSPCISTITNSDIPEENVENVSGIITDEKLNENVDENLVAKDSNDKIDADIENVVDVKKDNEKAEDSEENEKDKIDIDDAEIACEDEIIITEQENKRRMCLVM